MYLAGMQERALADSVKWFPRIHSGEPWAPIVHFTLGLAGEVGELVNLIKKANRSTNPFQYVRVLDGDVA